jgi:glycosyltransferase involved in cell wall biosynthesis
MKVILVSHHNPARFLEPPAPSNYSVLDARWAIRLEQRVLSKVDAVVAPSQYMRKFFKKTYQFSGSLRVIPNLLNFDKLKEVSVPSIRKQLGVAETSPLIYFPSPGGQLKGAEYVSETVRILRKLSGNTIAFYMPGVIEEKYKDEIDDLISKGDIFHPGQVSYDEHLSYVKQCSFVISLSLMENYSMALLEAALIGLPVIAFGTGGNADIVQSEKNGYLVSIGNLAKIQKYASILLNANSLNSFRKKAQAYSNKMLNSSIASRAYVELIESL